MYKFKPQEARDKIVEGLERLAEEQGVSKVVIPIYPDKNSAVGAALCARAVGRENIYAVIVGKPIDLAIHTKFQRNICFALALTNSYLDVGEICKRVSRDSVSFSDNSVQNIIYDETFMDEIALVGCKLIAANLGALVAGTRSLCDYTVGNFIDSIGPDFNLFSEMTDPEIYQVGLCLKELPKELLGKNNESYKDVSYETVHHYIRQDTQLDLETWKKIREMESKNYRKRMSAPPLYDPLLKE